ncbi:MAG: hypothetical protein MUC59_12875, partial [Saprospiraceae bacterium]|nr:hypothetical protein [Saprospiraceae bacterium]
MLADPTGAHDFLSLLQAHAGVAAAPQAAAAQGAGGSAGAGVGAAVEGCFVQPQVIREVRVRQRTAVVLRGFLPGGQSCGHGQEADRESHNR